MTVETPEQQPMVQEPKGGIAKAFQEIRTGLGSIEWPIVLLLGIAAGVIMPFSLLGGFGQTLSFFAGIVPVGAGLIIGRRVKGFYGLHGFFTGLMGAIASLLTLGALLGYTGLGPIAQTTVVPGQTVSIAAVFVQIGGFIAFSLLVFCTFGASMAGRTQERAKALRAEVVDRGGSLEKPGVVRTEDDIRGMSLPQFGSYVNNLFKKQGFTFKDYRFIDKDKHLDLWFERESEPWHVRLTVQDKVSPGTIEGLYQKMKEEGVSRGVVITSTEFLPSTLKAAKGRPIVLVDGKTLFEIAEG